MVPVTALVAVFIMSPLYKIELPALESNQLVLSTAPVSCDSITTSTPGRINREPLNNA